MKKFPNVAKGLEALRNAILNHKAAQALRDGVYTSQAKDIVAKSSVRVYNGDPTNALSSEFVIKFVIPNTRIDGEVVSYDSPHLRSAVASGFETYLPHIMRGVAEAYVQKAVEELKELDAGSIMSDTCIYIKGV